MAKVFSAKLKLRMKTKLPWIRELSLHESVYSGCSFHRGKPKYALLVLVSISVYKCENEEEKTGRSQKKK